MTQKETAERVRRQEADSRGDEEEEEEIEKEEEGLLVRLLIHPNEEVRRGGFVFRSREMTLKGRAR